MSDLAARVDATGREHAVAAISERQQRQMELQEARAAAMAEQAREAEALQRLEQQQPGALGQQECPSSQQGQGCQQAGQQDRGTQQQAGGEAACCSGRDGAAEARPLLQPGQQEADGGQPSRASACVAAEKGALQHQQQSQQQGQHVPLVGAAAAECISAATVAAPQHTLLTHNHQHHLLT